MKQEVRRRRSGVSSSVCCIWGCFLLRFVYQERCDVFQQFSGSPSGVLLCTVSTSAASQLCRTCMMFVLYRWDVCVSGCSSQRSGPSSGHLDRSGKCSHLLLSEWWMFSSILNVCVCLQFTPPTAAAEYVHRVGRTARIGGRGSSLLFLTPAETAFITELASHNIRSVDNQSPSSNTQIIWVSTCGNKSLLCQYSVSTMLIQCITCHYCGYYYYYYMLLQWYNYISTMSLSC